MTVAIIDYGSGNLRSAAKALERAARESSRRGPIVVTADPVAVARADRVVLPGVGAFADCRHGLTQLPGMIEALLGHVFERARPFLGICVGMQLLAEAGHEHGRTEGLSWLGGTVEPIRPIDPTLKVPHMGWNDLTVERDHPVLDGIRTGDHAYFVHGYHLVCRHPADRVARVDYGGTITAAVARANLFGTQFHPEKSQGTGLRLLANFLGWRP
jgi:glutamine amidotransferase